MARKLHIRIIIIALLTGIIMQSAAFGQTLIDGSFYSSSLDQTKMVDIYLPPGYDANPDLHYPVVYYLHGWGGNQNFLSTITSNATSKINSGEIDPMIIVCASNYTAPFDGSMYMNSEVHGDYEDYMINDLISWFDTTYRTVPEKKYRTVMGHSMGGYGAFRYGILHKDKFCGLASHATPANMEVIIDDFETHMKSENSGPPYSYNYSSTGNFTKMIFLGAGVWSPNLSSPQNYINPQVVEYPFDQQCNLIDTIFDKWDAHQVTTLVHNISPSDSIGILFGCGSNDELYFNIANDALQDTMDALSLDYEFYSHAGGHVLPTGFKNRALIFLDSLMSDPTTLPDDTTQTIDLIAGWNIHSFLVTPDTLDMLHIHDELINSGYLTKIIDESGGFVQYIPDIGWMNTIGDMELNEGYYIKVASTTQIDVTGQLSTSSCEIPFITGWNIMGYPLVEGQNALTAVQQLIDSNQLVKVISESGGFIQEIQDIGWINTIGNFLPGEGYYIQVNANTTLTLNCPASSNMLLQNPPVEGTVLFDKSYTNNPYNPMNIYVQDIVIDGIRVMEGDEIGVFDNDVCVGAGVITYENGNLTTIIVAAMDDPTTEEIDGYAEGNSITFKYLNNDLKYPIELVAEDVSGAKQFKSLGTYVVKLSNQLLAVEETDFVSVEVSTYPNPVDNKMTVAYNIPEGHVYICIINLNGSRVSNVINEYHEEGKHLKTIDASGLTQGFYVLQVRVVTKEKIYNKFHKFVKM